MNIRKPKRNAWWRWLPIFLALSIASGVHARTSGDGNPPTVFIDKDGWTRITPSDDSRIIYVSSSDGDDANDGMSPETAKATIAAGAALTRFGSPDHLLLKRGDMFVPASGLGRWKSGRSADEPLVVSYYGDSGARPLIIISGNFVHTDGQNRSYIAFVGLDFYTRTADPSSDAFDGSDSESALRFVGSGDWILVEDCLFRFAGLTVEGYAGSIIDFMFRRNVVADTWRTNSYIEQRHTSGIYMSNTQGAYLIEENVFDHNGWNEQVENAGANMFAHNVYIQNSNAPGGIIRGNIFARGAAHGVQARSGGIIERNVFVLNAVSLNTGGVPAPPVDPSVYTFGNRVSENVILNGRLMDPADSSWPRTGALWGVVAYRFHVDIEDNIVANRRDSGQTDLHYAFHTDLDGTYTLSNNISYQWFAGQDSVDASWPRPDHDLGDYYASIGGDNDTIAYLGWLRSRPLGEMPAEMTAYSAIDYIRAGFDRPAVERYDYSNLKVSHVVLNPTSLTLDAGASRQLMATVAPTHAADRSVNWTSDDETVATVNESGRITAVAAGTATITVEVVDGGYTASATVTVEAVPLTEWAGVEVTEGWASAGAHFLGWVYVEATPWLFSLALDGWIYAPEDEVTTTGVWAYLPHLGEIRDATQAPWVVSETLDTWLYVPEFGDVHAPHWAYVWNSGS